MTLARKVCASLPGILLVALLGAPGSIAIRTTGAVGTTQAANNLKTYRGAIGNSHIEMSLRTQGAELLGTYSYDRIRQDIKVAGRVDEQGRVQLTEYDGRGKPAAKFACKGPIDDPVYSECSWSRLNGSGERMVWLSEQHVAFGNGLRIVPKVISNRESNVEVSYPQVVGATGTLAIATQRFNLQVSQRVNQAIKDFAPEPLPARSSFDANYNILFGTNTLISIEMSEDSYSGGAHPNSLFWTMNYDLAANREMQLDDLFKPGADYKPAIAEYVTADINRRAERVEQANAERDGRKVTPREDPLVSAEQLPEISAFGITPKGLMIYFDFPHVMAFFDRTFVPYSVVAADLQFNVPGKP